MTGPDLAVVGAGPVGLACAIEARLAGLDVLLVDPREAPIDKACGEGLMPGALTALRRLGVDPPGRTIAGIAYLAAGSRAEHRFDGPPGRGVRRTVLHAALAERAEELGATSLQDRVTAVRQEGDRVVLTLPGSGEIAAPWAIAADGLHSPLRRLLALDHRPQPASRHRYGLRRHYAVEPWTDLVEVHWSESAEAYVTPVDEGTVGVAVLGPRPLDHAAVVASLPALAGRLSGAAALTEVRGAGPLLQRARARTAGRILLAGDASGYVDALTGEGLRVGFAQARAAIAAIGDGDPEQYERAWRVTTKDFRRLTSALVVAARSPLRGRIVPTAAWRPGLFGAVVERLAG